MDQNTDILLIEDNADDAGLTIRAFRKIQSALRIEHFSDGSEALRYIFCEGAFRDRDLYALPRLILLDLKMPRIDGLEVLKRIKSDSRTSAIPVVMLSSSNEMTDIRRCYQQGANSYVLKPVEFDDFLNTVSGIASYWLTLNRHA